MLTDGAVHNNGAIIELVRQNCNFYNKTRLHTFGFGDGADEHLIKGCAYAGMGNFSFIYNKKEIEEKVIEQMCLAKLDYLLVTQARILDEDDNVIEEMPGLPVPLKPATLFKYQTLLMNKPAATNFQFVI